MPNEHKRVKLLSNSVLFQGYNYFTRRINYNYFTRRINYNYFTRRIEYNNCLNPRIPRKIYKQRIKTRTYVFDYVGCNKTPLYYNQHSPNKINETYLNPCLRYGGVGRMKT